MTLDIRHWGICITCLQQSSCLGFQNSGKTGRAVWDCNEYESVAAEHFSQTRSAGQGAAREVTPAGIFMGLCSTCDTREHCSLPFREGGVWFCGDFR